MPRRIIGGVFRSLDGVIQAPGGPTEDWTGGFTLGGWSFHYWDELMGNAMGALFADKFDLLLGRKTYEIFAAHWPYYDENAPDGGIAKLFGEVKKNGVSRPGRVGRE